METYLYLFEQVIQEQIRHLGKETALNQANKAGLIISGDGHIVSCTGNPQLVLLRLIRHYTDIGNLYAIEACKPLIDEMLNLSEVESNETVITNNPD